MGSMYSSGNAAEQWGGFDEPEAEQAAPGLNLFKRVPEGSYQGLRHLMPGNLSPFRAMREAGEVQQQIDSLKEVNRLTPLRPPFVHRPNSRYVGSVLIKSEE